MDQTLNLNKCAQNWGAIGKLIEVFKGTYTVTSDV